MVPAPSRSAELDFVAVTRWRWALWLCLFTVSGCSGVQSTLDPAGRDAQRIANLFWVMTAFAGIIWALIMLLAFYAARARPDRDRRRHARLLIHTGAILPAVALLILMIWGLTLFSEQSAGAPANALRISVFGERWWWRIRYEPPGSPAFDVANEVRLPVGEPVELRLHSTNVIHSFWIPALGGKMDMIPGRVNRLVLHPTRTGRFRGACAEYCGDGHARMAFDVHVIDRRDFEVWLSEQARPSQDHGENP